MGDRAGELARVGDEDLGRVLQEEIRRFLDILGVPRGLSEVGYKNEDIATVSTGTGDFGSSIVATEGMPRCLHVLIRSVARRGLHASEAGSRPRADPRKGRQGAGARAAHPHRGRVYELVVWRECERTAWASSVIGGMSR